MDNAPQNSNPPPSVGPYSHHHSLYATTNPQYSPSYYVSHPQSENPNPRPHVAVNPPRQTHVPVSGPYEQGLKPPGVEPNSSNVGSLAHGQQAYDAGLANAGPQAVDAGAAAAAAAVQSAFYQQDPNFVESLKNWALEVLRYYGSIPNSTTGVTIPPNGTEQLVAAHANSIPLANAVGQLHVNGIRKKGPKKTKIVQSVWCEVCNVECNTKDVLDKHKVGKKHKKNVEKLKETIAPPPPVASGVSVTPVIGPQENPAASAVQKTKKKADEPAEDLESKRRKIMEGGAAADAVRMCTICNVVCNSELVFAYHIAGKKHASMMVKQNAGGQSVATAPEIVISEQN